MAARTTKAVSVSAVPGARRGLAAVGLAVLLGVVVELHEFGGFVAFGTVDQGFYTNTMLDLYHDVLGAGAAAVLGHRWDAWFGPAEAAGDPATDADPA
jgi:hypothetical protein